MAYGALQRFVWDFGQTALRRIFEGNFCRCPHFKNQGKTTTLRAVFPTLCDKCINYSTSPISQYRRDEGEGAYGFFVLIRED